MFCEFTHFAISVGIYKDQKKAMYTHTVLKQRVLMHFHSRELWWMSGACLWSLARARRLTAVFSLSGKLWSRSRIASRWNTKTSMPLFPLRSAPSWHRSHWHWARQRTRYTLTPCFGFVVLLCGYRLAVSLIHQRWIRPSLIHEHGFELGHKLHPLLPYSHHMHRPHLILHI